MEATKVCKSCPFRGPASQFQGYTCLRCKSAAGRARYARLRSVPKEIPARKRCTKCRRVKPAASFHRAPNAVSGLASHCKTCRSAKAKTEYDKTRGGRRGWVALRNSAKYRDLPFAITLDEYKTWWAETPDVCRYCGADFPTFAARRELILTDDRLHWLREVFANPNHAAIRGLSVDRRDPRRGYTLDNICKACWLCNYVKGAIITEHLMARIAEDLVYQISLVTGVG